MHAGEQEGLQKRMCEHLLFLPLLLAATFKCQDSSCPIRKDQSSHGEKSQYCLQFLTLGHRTSLFMTALEPADTSQPTGAQSQDSSLTDRGTRGQLWGQGPQHNHSQECTRAGNTHLESSAMNLHWKTKEDIQTSPLTHLPLFSGKRWGRWMSLLKC